MLRVLASLVFALLLGTVSFAQDAADKAFQEGMSLQAKDSNAAIASFQAAIALRKDNFAAAHFQLGLAYFAIDKIAEAAAEFDIAAEQDGEMVEVQPYIAELALFTPDFDKAVKADERYLDLLSPRDPVRFEVMKRLTHLRLLALEPGTENLPDSPVQVLSKPKPIYPETVKENIVGDVVVEVIFTADGEIHNPRVVQHLRQEFDDRALKLVSNLRFTPAIKQGKPVSQSQKFKLHFQRLYGETK